MHRQKTIVEDRKNLADRIAHRFKKLGEVDLMMIIESVGYGWADEFSDVDLLIGWHQIPLAEQRGTLLNQIKDANTHHLATNQFYEGPAIPQTNRDMFWHKGVMFDVHHVTTDGLEQLIHGMVELGLPEVLNDHFFVLWFGETREAQMLYHNQQIAAALQHGSVLFDSDGRTALWRKSLRDFPDALNNRISAALWACLDTYTAYWNPRIMVLRGSVCFLAWTMARRIRDMLWLFSLLNRKYTPGIGFSERWLSDLSCPTNFYQDICDLICTYPSDARVEKWTRLVEGIGDFVEKRLPNMTLPRNTSRMLAENAVGIYFHDEDFQIVRVKKNPHCLSERHKTIAEMIMQKYLQHNFVLAFGIFGSVAKGYVDCWSDMDLFIFCQQMPADEVRISILKSLCPNGGWNIRFPDTDVLRIEDVDIHIDYCTFEDGQWRGTPITLYPAEMESAKALFDPTVLVEKVRGQLRNRLYETTEKRILTENLPGILRHWHPAFRAAHRGDVIAFNCHISDLVSHAFPILSYMNGSEVYYLKWAERHLEQLSMKPKDAVKRMQNIMFGNGCMTVVNRWDEWCGFFDELMGLVEEVYPGMCRRTATAIWLSSQTPSYE